jgi:cyclopropane-fatty-acyl-phospholipid synthase
MPSQNLLPRFQDALRLEQQWRVNGSHYARSARAWIERMDERRGPVLAVLRDIYGPEAAETWFVRWRLFFMACEELFGFDGGEEWFVSHYLFARPGEGV